MGWADDIKKAVQNAAPGGGGTKPPGGVYQISGQWYNINNEPIDGSGRVIKDEPEPKYSEKYFYGGPQGPGYYTVNPDGTPGTLLKPDTGSGGGGSVSVSLNPNSTSAWSIREMPDGSIARINELTGAIETIVPAPQYSATNDRDRDGYDDSTGLPNGVVRVNTDISPTGLVYKGQPVNPDGSPYSGGSASTVGDYTSLKEGPGGIWGLNRKTGAFELVPGSQAFGTNPTQQYSGPVGGGGGSSSSGYASIATQMLSNQGALARIEAESAAAQARDAAQAALQKELRLLDQNFQREQSAAQNALTAMGMQQQFAIADAQLRQQYEQNKVNLIGQYRDALRDYDPRAVLQQIRDYGSLSSAMNENPSGFLTDNANAGAAALLAGLRRPYEGPQAPNFGQFTGMTGGLPATGVPGVGGAPSGGTEGGMTGGLPGSSQIGSAMPFMAPQVDTAQITEMLKSIGTPDAEIAAVLQDIATGQRSAQDFMLGGYYKSMTGNSQFLRNDANGGKVMPGGEMYGGSGYMPDTWQTVDPLGGNYAPHLIPKEPTSVSGMAGAGGDFVAPGPIPANHPMAGGLTGGVVAKSPLEPQAVIPMLANGGSFKGAAVVGEAGPELMIAPQGADVIPLSKPMAGSLLGSGMPGLASGTLSGGVLSGRRNTSYNYAPPPESTYTAPQPTYTPPVIPYSQPVQQPIPVVGSAPTVPTSTQAPVSSSPAPPSPAPTAQPTATNPLATPSPTQAAPPAPPTESNPAATGVEGLTAEEQALLAEIMATRTGTENMGMNPYDVAWGAQAPFFQDLFYRNEAQRLAVPEELYRQDVARNRLAGVGGGLQGALRY